MWSDGARCGLTCRSTTAGMAGCGLTWPSACGRWLPVWLPGWLPEIWLATLIFGYLNLTRPPNRLTYLGKRAILRPDVGLPPSHGGRLRLRGQ